jgi:hypothetical protein
MLPRRFPQYGRIPAQINRACNLMNELLHALKIKGYTVQVKGDVTNVQIGAQVIAVRLREKTTRKTIRQPGSSYNTDEYVPTGNLAIMAKAYWREREWLIRDGALPDEAADLVSKLERLSEDNHAQQVEHEAYWAERDKQIAAEQAIRDRRTAELKNFKDLLQAATRWRQAQWIREYLAAMEKLQLSSGLHPPNTQSGEPSPETAATTDPTAHPRVDPTTDLASWLAWAHAKADWYDPLTEKPDQWLAHINRDSLS